jgi:hypothetical protein
LFIGFEEQGSASVRFHGHFRCSDSALWHESRGAEPAAARRLLAGPCDLECVSYVFSLLPPFTLSGPAWAMPQNALLDIHTLSTPPNYIFSHVRPLTFFCYVSGPGRCLSSQCHPRGCFVPAAVSGGHSGTCSSYAGTNLFRNLLVILLEVFLSWPHLLGGLFVLPCSFIGRQLFALRRQPGRASRPGARNIAWVVTRSWRYGCELVVPRSAFLSRQCHSTISRLLSMAVIPRFGSCNNYFVFL